MMEKIIINTPFIRLDAFLKFSGMVGTGGQAKIVINEGLVKVNDEICTARGKKLFGGERVEFEGQSVTVVKEE